MTWTLVGEDTFNIQGDNNPHNVTLPGPPAEGDIVIFAHCTDTDISPGCQTSGYTTILTDLSATDPGHESAYKVMGSTPDTVVTLQNASGNDYTAGVVQVWRGVDTSTPMDQTPTSADGSLDMPNCPSITTQTNGALVVAIGFLDDDNIASSVTAPSGYSNVLAHDNTATGDNSSTMIASKEVASAGSEDPDAFGGDGYDAWWAATVALKPAAAVSGNPWYAYAQQ